MSDYPDQPMCPNCVTPWKCNGPHISEDSELAALRTRAEEAERELQAVSEAIGSRESAINYKASLYIAEIHEMADKARAEFSEPVEAAPRLSPVELWQLYTGWTNVTQQHVAYTNGQWWGR